MSTSTAAAPPATSGAEGPESAVGVDATGVVSGAAFDGADTGAEEGAVVRGSALGEALAGAFAFAVLDGVGDWGAGFFSAAGNTTSEHE